MEGEGEVEEDRPEKKGPRQDEEQKDGEKPEKKKPLGRKPVVDKFHKLVADLGGKVLGTYENNRTPVLCECKNGHRYSPWPSVVLKGGAMCRICAGTDTQEAERKLRARVAELGGTVIGTYVGAATKIECLCPNGHICTPCPYSVTRGQGMCRTCAGQAPGAGEQRFLAKMKELGAKVIGKYKGYSLNAILGLHPFERVCVQFVRNVREPGWWVKED